MVNSLFENVLFNILLTHAAHNMIDLGVITWKMEKDIRLQHHTEMHEITILISANARGRYVFIFKPRRPVRTAERRTNFGPAQITNVRNSSHASLSASVYPQKKARSYRSRRNVQPSYRIEDLLSCVFTDSQPAVNGGHRNHERSSSTTGWQKYYTFS